MPMYDDPRFDPEMRAVQIARDAEAARHPPILATPPLDEQRAASEALNLRYAAGGPVMADSADRWVPALGRRVLCRVHRARSEPVPAVIYFHGGGWVFSSIDTHDRVARDLAYGAGCGVVNVDYALSPEARFPRALEECAAIIRHVAARGAEWGLDGSRIVLAGDSAGANLALGAALLLRDTGGPPLCGILAWYPVCDPDFTTDSYREFATGYGLTAEAMRIYWDHYAPDPVHRISPYAAPLRATLRDLPPVLVQLAELDVLRSEGEALAGRLFAAGVDVETETQPGLTHGYIRATAEVARARLAMERACAWLRRIIG